jgi:hypothetical protein
MQIHKVRVHTCANQKIEGYIAERCRCRKFISVAKAEELKNTGFAANVIVSFKTIKVEEVCPICINDSNLKKSCKLCGKTGQLIKEKHVFEYGTDVYMTPFQKTPRTATVEEEHIEYAYIKNDKDAARRIELYNDLTQLSLAQLGAALIDGRTGEIVVEGNPEPKNDPKTATGRDYDYGRSI